MKKFSLKILLVTLALNLLNYTQVLARVKPPTPSGSGGFDDDYVVGGDIDSHIIILFMFSILFGIWITVKRNKKVILLNES